jgi:inorganic pyrophosphatase
MLIDMVVEIQKGSRDKYELDHDRAITEGLSKVIPERPIGTCYCQTPMIAEAMSIPTRW